MAEEWKTSYISLEASADIQLLLSAISSSIQLTVFLTAAIQFQILSPPNQADERHPGIINVPIQVTLAPVTSVLQDDIAVFVSVLGGTATGKKILWFCVDRNLTANFFFLFQLTMTTLWIQGPIH